MQSFVRKTGCKIKGVDLTPENGFPKYSYFHNHGYTVAKINQCIEAEKIISESKTTTDAVQIATGHEQENN